MKITMLRTMTAVVATLMAITGASHTQAAATLAETRAAVLAGNPSVYEARQRIDAARAVLDQTRAAYRPSLSLSGTVGHIHASLHPDIDLQHRYTDGYRQAKGTVQADYLLFDGFARRARELAAEKGVEQSRHGADDLRRLLIEAATVAFRRAQLAEQNIKSARRDRQFNASLQQDAEKRHQAGALPESEVHNFSIRVLQAENAVSQAQLNYQTACAALAELMALPDAVLPDALKPVEAPFGIRDAKPELDAALTYALDHRPDYQAVVATEQARKQQVRVAEAERYPDVVLTGTMNYAQIDGRSTVDRHGNFDSFVGVALKWDGFTGGRRDAAIRKAEAEARAANRTLESMRLSIRSALRRQIDRIVTLRDVFERQTKIHTLSKKVRASVKKAYRAGSVAVTRLNEAQTDVVRADAARAAALVDYLLALNQLDIETAHVLEQ